MMSDFPDHAQLSNLKLIEDLYERYLENPESVDPSWRHFFSGFDFGASALKAGMTSQIDQSSLRIFELIEAYRVYGHLQAQINPLEKPEKAKELALDSLGFYESEMDQEFPTLGFCGKEKAPLKEIIQALEHVYSGSIGFEYKGTENPELEKWIQERIEPNLLLNLNIEDKHLLLESLNRSEILETFLHAKYVGQTRFSLEGGETTIPVLAEIIDLGAELGAEEFVIGMAHRGRLNVLTNILNKPIEMILEEFEDDITLSFFGNDDVRYHMGYDGEWKNRTGKKAVVSMAANPSHLESVDPVVIGQVYAKQVAKNDKKKEKIAPIVIHGDASIAGQGVVYETMQLMNLPNYSVGGTLHIVINNQIGYTTLPKEGRSTRYCTDIAKAFGCPVFHVNAEDPESCVFAAKLAIEIRQKFHTDVFIDILCYRKYGHNEGDEPSFTQPLQYKAIREKKTIREIYFEQLKKAGALENKMAESLELQFNEKLKNALTKVKEKIENKTNSPPEREEKVPPKIAPLKEGELKMVLETFCKIPEGFHPHPKLQKWLGERLASINGKMNWATGECLAFGSLLSEGISIRLAGQDSQRGTFSQRHMIWTDFETGKSYCPLCNLQSRLEVVNSALTENAGMGFEFGYACESKDSLVLWEGQYGDFYNGAQVIVDQYIACSEPKWKVPSNLVLLLPHGYEGAGPEHSSGRMERFLQLAADDNMQVANPSTPAQYFHLLRRQAYLAHKKPLIIFTPKSLLRSEACTSVLEEFAKGQFEPVLDDPSEIKGCKRLLFCSGKVFYNLLSVRKSKDVAIVRIEELYPLRTEKIRMFIDKYAGFKECFWVQEEPQNMGAWQHISPLLKELVPSIQYLGRPPSATTATGSSKKHKQEQAELLEKAIGEK